MNTFACIDIGGTAIKYGLLQADGSILFKTETPTEAWNGGPALAQKVKGIARELQEINPEIQGIAISSAGVVNSDTASIIHASDAIPAYAGVNYREVLEELNLPLEIENDVNCAGLSEYASGQAQGTGSVLVLTVGTGIGGCFIQQGQLLNGNSYSACEIGYLPLRGSDFQTLGSTTALVANVAARKNMPVEEWNGRLIFDAAAKGDVDCLEAIVEMCDILGEGIAAVSFILNPEMIVFGGGIMAQESVLRPLIESSFRKYSIPLIANSTAIEFAAHQNDAGMKGALVHFLNRHPELNQ